MKQLLVGVVFAVAALKSAAQAKPIEDSLINLMKEDICKELAKVPESDFTADNFEMQLGMLMISVFGNYDAKLKKIYGENYTANQNTLSEVGKKIGMKLAVNCKVFQQLIIKNPSFVNAAMAKNAKQKSADTPVEKLEEITKVPSLGFVVKVLSFTQGEISFYTVKDKSVTKRVYWLGKFNGDDELIANPRKIIGKSVFFRAIESKVYSATERVYKKILVVIDFDGEPIEEIIEDQVIVKEPVKN
jgi:hypothetical protein